MRYRAPAFVEIKMDAEIGSYQEDDGPGRDDVPPVVVLAPVVETAAESASA